MVDEYSTLGPFLQMAVLCEKVLREQDGVVSLIRIIDRMTITASGDVAPDKMPQGYITVTIMLGFKAGGATGSHVVDLIIRDPSGDVAQHIQLPMFLEGQDRGVTASLEVGLTIKEEGLYWFDVVLGGRLITRMPLRLVYQRLAFGGSKPPSQIPPGSA